MIFSEHKGDRAMCFIVSTLVIIVLGPMAVGFTTIYPTNTLLLRLLKSITGTALILVVQFAALVWIWSLFKAAWAKAWFEKMKSKLVLTMVALPILVGMWFLTGLK